MRWVSYVTATAAATALLAAAAPANAADKAVTRFTAAGGSATWGWHKVAQLPDGTRTFRTGYLRFSRADLRRGADAWTEDDVYAHTEDYTYRGDDSFAGRVNRLFAGSRDTLTFTVAADYSSARLTGTMVETDCDTWYEVCAEVGAVPVDVVLTAVGTPWDATESSTHPTRWISEVTRIFDGGGAEASASGTLGPVALVPTQAASYTTLDALTTSPCRAGCPYE